MSDIFLKKACRTCLKLNEAELFDWNSGGFVKGFNYAQCFQEVTQLPLSQDMPEMLCYDCAYELRITHSFINRAHKTTTTLRSYINNKLKNKLSFSSQEKSALFEMQTVDLDEITQPASTVSGQIKIDDLLAETVTEAPVDPFNELHQKSFANLIPTEQSCDLESQAAELVLSQPAPTNLPHEEGNQHQTLSSEYVEEPSDLILFEDSKLDSANDSSSDMEFVMEAIKNSKEEMPYGTEEISNGSEETTEPGIPENNSQTAATSKNKRTYRQQTKNDICKTCGAAFARESSLKRHEHTAHNGPPPVITPKKCDLCEEIFNTRSKMERHKVKAHGVRPWLCHQCPLTFKLKFCLDKHVINKHSNREHKYSCDVCGIKCLSKGILSGHMKVHEKDRKPKFACDECDKTFYVRSGLVMHKRLHSGDTFNCSVCNKALPRLIDLKVHLRTHSKERPYQCDICPLSFQNVSYLRFHKQKHEGMQYKCDVCDKVYHTIYSLEDHKTKHDDPLFQCQICDKKFYNKYKLKRHIKGVHQISTNDEAEEFVIYLKGKIFKGRRYDPKNKAYNTLIPKS